jgi:O-antigen/teichoic acid export membrane protein
MSKKSDFLIVVSSVAIKEASKKNDFIANDWSMAWLNTLRQEVGPADICYYPEINDEIIASHRVIIISRSAMRLIREGQIGMLGAFVKGGGTLILEQPQNNFKDLSGIESSHDKVYVKRISWISPEYSNNPRAEVMKNMPLNTFLYKVKPQCEDVKSILSMDGYSALFIRKVGKGVVITLNFNYGLQLVSIQQGVPLHRDYRLGKRFGLIDKVIEPEDILIDETMRDNLHPFADMLERFIINLADLNNPLPKWWYFPEGYLGGLIMSHDDEGLGLEGQVKTLMDYEASKGIPATFFIISDHNINKRFKDVDYLQKLKNQDLKIGIHWNRFPFALPKLLRKLKIKFNLPLSIQIKKLKDLFKDKIDIVANRTHYLSLGRRYAQDFIHLAGLGIRIDSTYGPNKGGRGYLFGTGYPFYPVNRNGCIVPILEAPFHAQEDWYGADLKFINKLLKDSEDFYHQLIILSYHPQYEIVTKDIETIGQLFQAANTRQHGVTTFNDFNNFLEKRYNSALNSSFNESGDITTVIEARSDNLTISVPFSSARNNSSVKSIRMDGSAVSYKITDNIFRKEALVNVPQGKHVIEVVYSDYCELPQEYTMPPSAQEVLPATFALESLFSKIRDIIHNTVTIIFGDISLRCLNFIASVSLARYFGTYLFGEFNFVFTYLSFFEIFAQFGMNSILVREISKDESKADILLGNVFILKMAWILLSVLVACVTIAMLNYNLYLQHLIWFSSLSLFLTMRTLFDSVLRVKLKNKYIVFANIAKGIAYVSLIYLLIFMKGSVFYAVLVSIFSGAIGLAGAAYFSLKYIKPKFKFDLGICRYLIMESAPLLCSGFLTIIYYRIDVIMLSKMKTYADIGYYTAATRLTELFSIFPGALMASLFPILTEYYTKFKEVFIKIYRESIIYLSAFILPIAIIFTVFSNLIILKLYGDKFLPSSSALSILIWSEVLGYIGIILVNVLIILGKQKIDLYVSGLMVFLNIFLNLLLIPRYSFNGASIATVATECLGSFIWAIYLFRSFKLNFPILKFFGILISGLFFLGIILLGSVFSISFLLTIPLAILLYIVLLFITKAIEKKELSLLKSAFISKNLKN